MPVQAAEGARDDGAVVRRGQMAPMAQDGIVVGVPDPEQIRYLLVSALLPTGSMSADMQSAKPHPGFIRKFGVGEMGTVLAPVPRGETTYLDLFDATTSSYSPSGPVLTPSK